MPKISLPVFFSQSHDETSLPDQVGARLVNGYVDKIGEQTVIRKAPGLEIINDLYDTHSLSAQKPAQGTFWWDNLGIEITVVNGRFYKKATASGTTVDITGDALTNTTNPVMFVTNGWMLMAASGGQIVTYHLYPKPYTAPGLTLGTQKDRLKFVAFTYYINGVLYTASATDNISPGTEEIPQNKYGCVALDIDAAGAVTAVSAAANATGYTTAALAIAGLPACVETKCRIGWVTVMKSDGGFIFDTTEFDAANVTEVYADNTLWSADTTILLADSDAPTAVTHLGYLDGYIIANEYNTARFRWCDADTPNLWGALSFASAEGQPDKIVALHVSNREITLFGTDSTETFYNDGVSPFSRYEGGYVEVGCIAPYTIVGMAGSFIFLNHERRVILLEGRTPTPMSSPYDDVIRDIDKVSDAYAIYFALGVQSFYVISFPSVNRSFCLNLTTKTWAEWGDWSAPDFLLYKARCYCYAKDWEMHIVGDNTNAYLYKIRGDHYKYGADTIRTLMRTGHVSHGTMEPKISQELMMHVKRGVGDGSGGSSEMTIRWRNEDLAWKNERTVSLGEIGEYNMIKRLFRNGVYRTRQYEITHTENSDFVLSDMEEKILLIGQPSSGKSV